MSSYPDDQPRYEDVPEIGRLGGPKPSGLGSLAQSARGKHLRQARGILIAIGVLTILANGAMFFLAESMVHDQIQKEVQKAGPGMVFDQAKLRDIEESEVRERKLVFGGTALLGVVFILLGSVVKQYPVPATAIGLVLYIGGNVIFAVLDPKSMGGGIIIKIIIIVGLVKSLQAAIAYQRESQAAAAAGESPA